MEPQANYPVPFFMHPTQLVYPKEGDGQRVSDSDLPIAALTWAGFGSEFACWRYLVPAMEIETLITQFRTDLSWISSLLIRSAEESGLLIHALDRRVAARFVGSCDAYLEDKVAVAVGSLRETW
jgi:hypothetical protein